MMGVQQLFLINTLMTTTRNGDKRFSFTSTAYEKGLQKVCKAETVNQQLFNFLVLLFCSIQQQHRKQNQIS